MQRYAALGDKHARHKMQVEFGVQAASGRYPVDYCPIEEVDDRLGPQYNKPDPKPGHPYEPARIVADLELLHYFDAPDPVAARAYFNRLQQDGCPVSLDIVGHAAPMAKILRYRGDGKHLSRRIEAMGLGHIHLKHVQANEYFKRISVLLNQVTQAYWESSRIGGVPMLTPQQRAGAKESLRRAELELDHLAAIFGAAADALDDVYDALGIENSRRYTKPELKAPPKPEPLSHPKNRPHRQES